MEKFGINSISVDNVSVIKDKIFNLHRILNCEYADIAINVASHINDLLNMGLGYYEIFAMISDELLDESLKSDILTFATESDFVLMLCERLLEFGIMPDESDLLPSDTVEETFTYVKNMLADEAYDVFSQDFSDPRGAYAGGFKEAAEGASKKRVGFCILPLEERAGTRIPGISSIILSEDLKIVAVSPVFGLDGNADMKYALLSSEFKVPTYETGDERYLEIMLETGSDASLSALLIASESFQCELFRINTSFYENDDAEIPYYSIIFKTKKQSFSDFLVYLAMFCPDYISVGLYKNLE